MKDFPFIWLLFNTKTGKIILGIIIAYFVVMLVGWWLVPVIAALIAILLFYDYYSRPKKGRNKASLIIGICLCVFALLFALGIIFHKDLERWWYKTPDYYEPTKTEKVIVSQPYVPDTIIHKDDKEKTKPVKSSTYSSSSRVDYDDYEEDEDDDNMRGFDPASEDDMDDNGLSRYMENDDDEGWD